MYNLQEISQKGKLFRQQFNEIDFVGELKFPKPNWKVFVPHFGSIFNIPITTKIWPHFLLLW